VNARMFGPFKSAPSDLMDQPVVDGVDPTVSASILSESEVNDLWHLLGEPYVDATTMTGRENKRAYAHQLFT
jgi:hypothetical protein